MTTPVVLLTPEDTVYGRVYHPANRIAKQFAAIAGSRAIPEDVLPYIRELGFEIAEPNGQPLPHPSRAYQRVTSAQPMHILDEA